MGEHVDGLIRRPVRSGASAERLQPNGLEPEGSPPSCAGDRVASAKVSDSGPRYLVRAPRVVLRGEGDHRHVGEVVYVNEGLGDIPYGQRDE